MGILPPPPPPPPPKRRSNTMSEINRRAAKRKEQEKLNMEIDSIFDRLDKSFDRTFNRGDQAFEKAGERFRAAEARMRESEKRLRDKLQRVTRYDGDSITQVSISRNSSFFKLLASIALLVAFLIIIGFGIMIASISDKTKPEPLNPPVIEKTVEGERKL